jgi:acetylornithine deacetylase/succinyl-diaminopimelate desuccinylase-like protein
MELQVEQVIAYLNKNFDTDLERVRDFLRIPSISYTGEGIEECANRVKELIEELGGTGEVVPTKGHPVVYGELDQQAPHTILIYGMYDVMPTDEPGWTVEPFGAEIKDLPQFGPCIINRGAVNTKGPLGAFFNVLRAIQTVEGKLPFNFLFAIEGEEEWGSRHFPEFVEQYREKLAKADVMLFPFFTQDEAGMPSMTLGTKGILYFELICQGGEWGGPTERGIHGSFNAWVNNPAWRLVKALSTLVDDEENIVVENFFEDVSPLYPEDAESLRRQVESGVFNEETFKESYHVKRLKGGLTGYAAWERMFGQPQLNIDGIEGGYTGPETKTLLPHLAKVKVDVRMVPHMEPEKVVQSIRKHLDSHGFADIEMKVYHNYPWSKVSVHEHAVEAMVESYVQMGQEPQIYPLNQGSAPYYVFERTLQIPYVFGGMGHGSRQHSSDEYCTVDGVLKFEESIARFFSNYLTRIQD